MIDVHIVFDLAESFKREIAVVSTAQRRLQGMPE